MGVRCEGRGGCAGSGRTRAVISARPPRPSPTSGGCCRRRASSVRTSRPRRSPPATPRSGERGTGSATRPTRLAPSETAPATSPRATAPAKGRGPSGGGGLRWLVVGGLGGGRGVARGRGDPGDVLGDVAGERLRGQPDVGQDLGARGVVEELLRDAERADRDV